MATNEARLERTVAKTLETKVAGRLRVVLGWVTLRRLAVHGIHVSMSRTGNCYDNAVMQSFFATLKTKCVDGRYATRQEARA